MSDTPGPAGETFASRLISSRKAAGLSQKALADLLNSSQSSVAEWEAGKSTPRLQTMAKIARILGVGVSETSYGEFNIYDSEAALKSTRDPMSSAEQIIDSSDNAKAYLRLFDQVLRIIQRDPSRLNFYRISASYLHGLHLDVLHAAVIITQKLWEAAMRRPQTEILEERIGFQIGFFAAVMEKEPSQTELSETD